MMSSGFSGHGRAWGSLGAGLLVLALSACGADAGEPGPAAFGTDVNASADGAGCVTLDVDQITVDELTADADAGRAASEQALDGNVAGEAAESVAQMSGLGKEQFAGDPVRLSDGAVRSFTRDLCASGAYDRDLDWLRGQGASSGSIADTVVLYNGMQSHPGLVIATLGVSTCTTVEMFGGERDAESLTESESPLQSEVARLALRYLCSV